MLLGATQHGRSDRSSTGPVRNERAGALEKVVRRSTLELPSGNGAFTIAE
jgi:hypothetical protein